MSGEDYRAFFDRAVGDMAVRIPVAIDQPLRIFGLLEARLLASDVMILAGLNERLWPREPDADPWLTRPERERLGLQTPERRIGLSAHDFVQCAAAAETWLCTSAKVGGHSAVPSQFLLRLEALLSAAGLGDALTPRGRLGRLCPRPRFRPPASPGGAAGTAAAGDPAPDRAVGHPHREPDPRCLFRSCPHDPEARGARAAVAGGGCGRARHAAPCRLAAVLRKPSSGGARCRCGSAGRNRRRADRRGRYRCRPGRLLAPGDAPHRRMVFAQGRRAAVRCPDDLPRGQGGARSSARRWLVVSHFGQGRSDRRKDRRHLAPHRLQDRCAALLQRNRRELLAAAAAEGIIAERGGFAVSLLPWSASFATST